MSASSFLSRVTGGYHPSPLAPFVPANRLVTVKGSLRDVLGRPVARERVFITPYVAPSFNLQDLLAIEERHVDTDATGGISTNPHNRVCLLRSTNEEASYVRVRIPTAGADWVLRMPRDLDLVLLKDLVRTHLVTSLL